MQSLYVLSSTTLSGPKQTRSAAVAERPREVSRSLKVIRNDSLEYSMLVLYCNYTEVLCLVSFMKNFVSHNSVTLKSGLGLMQGH